MHLNFVLNLKIHFDVQGSKEVSAILDDEFSDSERKGLKRTLEVCLLFFSGIVHCSIIWINLFCHFRAATATVVRMMKAFVRSRKKNTRRLGKRRWRKDGWKERRTSQMYLRSTPWNMVRNSRVSTPPLWMDLRRNWPSDFFFRFSLFVFNYVKIQCIWNDLLCCRATLGERLNMEEGVDKVKLAPTADGSREMTFTLQQVRWD